MNPAAMTYKGRREMVNKTQHQMADLLGLRVNTYARWERGMDAGEDDERPSHRELERPAHEELFRLAFSYVFEQERAIMRE